MRKTHKLSCCLEQYHVLVYRINRNYQTVKYRCNGGHLEFSGTNWPDMYDPVTE